MSNRLKIERIMPRINEHTFELNGEQYHLSYYEKPVIIKNGLNLMVKPVLREYIETYNLPIELCNKNGNLETTNSLADKVLKYFSKNQKIEKDKDHYINKNNDGTVEINENNKLVGNFTWTKTNINKNNTVQNTVYIDKVINKRNTNNNISILLTKESIIELATKHEIKDFDVNNEEHLKLLNERTISEVKHNKGKLPTIPPFEKHPYLTPLIPNNNISGLMIGTFPTISYLCDLLQLPILTYNDNKDYPPLIPYFHGNKNSLWKYSPIGFEKIKRYKRNDIPNLIEKNLLDKGIIYTDIIKFCQREIKENNYCADDKSLTNIVINESIYEFLFDNVLINRIYFTNSVFIGDSINIFNKEGNYNIKNRDAFILFLKGANNLKYKIEIKNQDGNFVSINAGIRDKSKIRIINDFLKNKVIVELRFTKNYISKEIQVCSSCSPASHGKVKYNKCVLKYGKNHLMLLKEVLNSFFENNINKLKELNVD